MISQNINNFNIYDDFLEKYNINGAIYKYYDNCSNIDLSFYKCPCCNSFSVLVRHGYYTRYIIINGDKYKIKILRVKCKNCSRTHAVLPSFIIPYIQTPFNEVINIIDEYNNSSNKSNITSEFPRIIKAYKQWIARLKSIFLSFNYNYIDIIKKSIETFKLYIFQIHRGCYYFFL